MADAHAFEITDEAELDATPEQVWEAIATGPGWDSWFMGRNEIEPGEGGTVRWSIGDFTEESKVTAWDPPHRFVSTSRPALDGSYNQFEYTIEKREGGRTGIRFVHTGMRSGDWQAEYEAMSEGDPVYFAKLLEYVTYFSGRFGTPVDVTGPPVSDRDEAMATFRRGLGVGGDIANGDQVRLTPEGLPTIEGTVDCISPSFFGMRSDDALYRFICSFDGRTMVGHHLFADGVDEQRAEREWRGWLERLFAPSGAGASG